jgi:hypothetical protein
MREGVTDCKRYEKKSEQQVALCEPSNVLDEEEGDVLRILLPGCVPSNGLILTVHPSATRYGVCEHERSRFIGNWRDYRQLSIGGSSQKSGGCDGASEHLVCVYV